MIALGFLLVVGCESDGTTRTSGPTMQSPSTTARSGSIPTSVVANPDRPGLQIEFGDDTQSVEAFLYCWFEQCGEPVDRPAPVEVDGEVVLSWVEGAYMTTWAGLVDIGCPVPSVLVPLEDDRWRLTVTSPPGETMNVHGLADPGYARFELVSTGRLVEDRPPALLLEWPTVDGEEEYAVEAVLLGLDEATTIDLELPSPSGPIAESVSLSEETYDGCPARIGHVVLEGTQLLDIDQDGFSAEVNLAETLYEATDNWGYTSEGVTRLYAWLQEPGE